MDAHTRYLAVKHFVSDRAEYTDLLKSFAEGNTLNRTALRIKSDLLLISNTLWIWACITDTSLSDDTICFPRRCKALAIEVQEVGDDMIVTNEGTPEAAFDGLSQKIFGMLVLQIGRLTVPGYVHEDWEAERDARLAEREQSVWFCRDEEGDDVVTRILRRVWERLHVKVAECACRQCCDFYCGDEDCFTA
ncbi:uncharacterized protein N7515_000319 [Penicillium bovifimosum]|uniref:Uncharacterized protein n=1 Tax=Penicillium bovifimosum TaxID=126998 RepID=A0A9W9HH29_9EURO|nr:uncharacterized protein N7515_000319 [Penicillium bovifimosum]KAJ5145755.1 hypothetical protein N7515_000319 [Penicillium bovifimosum]